MSLYKCVFCNDTIQATSPRLTCSACAPPMTLCASCYVLQDYPEQHPDASPHSISLLRHSGYLPTPPPPPPRTQSVRQPYTRGPPRPRPMSAAYSEVPPRKPPRPTIQTPTDPPPSAYIPVSPQTATSQSATPQSATPQPEFRQPPSMEQHVPPQYHQPTGWTPLFNHDMTPSPCFLRTIQELFHHLDPQQTGFLSPEVYSQYLDACGAPITHNCWKDSRQTNPNNYDIPDRALTEHYTAYSVDFTLRPRTPPTTPVHNPLDPLSYLPANHRDKFSRFMPPAKTLSGNQKPMLSFNGFKTFEICSALTNPSMAWTELTRVCREYRVPVWQECGDIPRDMLPLAPYQPEVERVRVLLEGSRVNAEIQMDALQARLKMEQKGRQNALDLIDDRVWVYR